ncbi:MAG: NAD-dependent epimerase/dehydratase family protein [Alphaproteobacteria bacterium]|nr:NAD-dependent epimerase/dehydratase family protein [Alphaproteobacteria bacterium]
MNVLVTGGAGFIGSHTVDKLVSAGIETVVIDRSEPKYKNDKATYYRLDLNDAAAEDVFKTHAFDAVIHLAAQASVAVSVADPVKDATDNVMASVRVIEYGKKYGVKKIIVSSSAALYAVPQYLPVDEKHPVSFLSPYALSKHAMEEYVKLSGLDYIIFRYANVYGPRQDPHGEAGVVSIFIEKMIKNLPLEIHGDGEQTRDFVYVADVAEMNCRAVLSPASGVVLNVSTNTQTSVNGLFARIKENTDYTLAPVSAPSRAGDIKHSVLNNALALKTLGFKPETALTDGLKETVAFFKRTY